MRILFICLAVYSALIIFSELASAQDENINPAVMIEAWTVKPFTRVNGVPSGECIMSADYNNGFELAFKGKNHQLTALRIKAISGQAANKTKGFIGLGLENNSYGLQSKVQNGQIDASLLNVPAAGEVINDLPMFRIRIGADDYYFSTAGFNAGFAELQTCQGDNSLTTLKVVDSTRQSVLPVQKIKDESQVVLAIDESDKPIYLFKDKSVEMLRDVKEVPASPELLPMQEIDRVKGKQSVPLAMAMPMLVPSGYSYQFDSSVNGMTPVSWDEGGKWEDRLRQSVSDHGYVVNIEEKNIKITASKSQPEIVKPIVMMNDDETTTVSNPADVVELTDVAAIDTATAAIPKRYPPIKAGYKWSADKGERVQVVLKRWAKKAEVNTEIDLDNDPILRKDFVAIGPFELAVNGLLQDVALNSVVKPSAVIQYGDEKATHGLGYEGGLMPIPVMNESQPNHWRALQGTNLRKVLQRWSAEEGVNFVWDTDQQFYVPQSVKATTDFADAVSLILSQFQGQPIRPKAILNFDPETKSKALVIQSDKSS